MLVAATIFTLGSAGNATQVTLWAKLPLFRDNFGHITADLWVSVRMLACCTLCMDAFHRTRSWRVACFRLVAYDRIPGYRRVYRPGYRPGYRQSSWYERKCLDHAAVVMLFRASSFRRALFGVGVATVLMYVVTWEWDLVGASRDLLRALPLIASFPPLAAARRNNIRALLRNREADHGQVAADASQ